MKRLAVGAATLLSLRAAALLTPPAECGACPPVEANAEWILLELEAVEVDGVRESPPGAYADVRLEVIQAWTSLEPRPLVLIARRDTATLFQAYFE